ncbi:hypothetical protein EZ444_00690 [Pedobacter hiemivivus]|uniref:PKD-like family protein n=2 Tax=Pedobacter hiemivivus TaxID=2530454 RepID=A0A4R0NIN2_9SPHI|nr:hypothetical protein EZ444_00690 [Pedobacter hiemivivus]
MLFKDQQMKMINKKISGVLLLTGMVFLSSCYKDKSTLALTELNKVGLSDPKTLTTLNVFQGQVLNLKPTLSQSLSDKMDQLEFEWSAYDNSTTSSYVVPEAIISKEYELKYLVNGDPFTLGQRYLLRLTVKDKSTGLKSFLNYNLLIGNRYGTGWLVLEDKAGKGDLSFVFTDNAVEHGIYSDRNTTQLIGPKKLELTPFAITDDISASGKRLYILADNGSQEYNYLTMVKKFDYAFEFFSAPSIIKPQVMTWTSPSTNSANRSGGLGVVINNGKMHSNLIGGFPGIKKWGDVALNPEGNTNYNLAPFATGGNSYPAIVYDNTAKRFYNVRGYSPTPIAGSLEAFPSAASTEFDMNNVGMTMIFQDSADVVKEFNAVMKDGNNQAYLLRYKTEKTDLAPRITLKKELMNAPGILNYTAASGSTSTPHIYYGNANTVSRYETSSNVVVETYSFPAAEQVTSIKYAKYTAGSTSARLLVATWNGTEGKLYYFTITNVGGMGSYTNVFNGFGKIVDLAYKY